MCRWTTILFLQLSYVHLFAQTSFPQNESYLFADLKTYSDDNHTPVQKQFLSTTDFLDAAINSLNSFNSLQKKKLTVLRLLPSITLRHPTWASTWRMRYKPL